VWVGCYDGFVLTEVRRRLIEVLPDDQGMMNSERDAIEFDDRR
jgi:hypothetical protein